MSTQQITDLWERIQSDEEFRGRVERAATPQEKREVVRAAGYEVNPGDLGTLRSLAGTEISDADLEKVAGGSGTATLVGTIVGAAPIATAAAAAAALA